MFMLIIVLCLFRSMLKFLMFVYRKLREKYIARKYRIFNVCTCTFNFYSSMNEEVKLKLQNISLHCFKNVSIKYIHVFTEWSQTYIVCCHIADYSYSATLFYIRLVVCSS